jgi:hypothetical protein
MEKIRNPEGRSTIPFRFGTSLFAVGEITRVISDEYICKQLYEARVPYQYWEAYRRSHQLTDDDVDQLSVQIGHFLNTFLLSRSHVLSWFEGYHVPSLATLIAAVRVSTTDAFLVGAAMRTHCKYFVTEDQPLRKLLRGELNDEIQGISAQAMLSEILKAQK